MFENNSKYPRFFAYLELILALIILITMFFSFVMVASAYFIALILFVVYMLLDKKYGSSLSNYKQTFFLFDFINLVGIIAILYYEYTNHSMVLNICLIVLIILKVFSMLVDMYIIKNENLSSNEYVLTNIVQLCFMICILTYFFNVSTLFFAIDALFFSLASIILKLYINRDNKPKKTKEVKENLENIKLEERIRSAGKDEGELE